jgi:hypothetical protein
MNLAIAIAVGGFYDRNATKGQVITYLVILLFVCVGAYLAMKGKIK